jgi:MYXO-CTERM domain-containing protein
MLATAGLSGGGAWGNAGSLPDNVDVFMKPGDTTNLPGLEATFGLLLPQSDSFYWMCHEVMLATNSPVTPRFFINADGVILATVQGLGIALDPDESVFRSTDTCTWAVPTGLTDVAIWDIDVSPTDPTHILASSATFGATTNGLWESTDSGATWAKANLERADQLFHSVVWAPGNDQVIWATSAFFNPKSAYVYRTINGGAAWAETAWTFEVNMEPQVAISVVAASPASDQTAYIRVDGVTTDYLFITTDGGALFTQVFTADDNIVDVEYDDAGNVWLITQGQGTFFSTDGTNFTSKGDTPLVRGVAADARGVFAAVSGINDGYALGQTTDDGGSYDQHFTFKDLSGTYPCAAGTDVQTICEPLWPALAQRLGIPTPTEEPSPSPTTTPGPGGGGGGGGGCNCTLSADSPLPPAALAFAALCLLAGLTLILRRR